MSTTRRRAYDEVWTRLEPDPAEILSRDRRGVVDREPDADVGIRIGSVGVGWLTATGTAVLSVALIVAAEMAVGFTTLLVILFAAYYSGGYVAGRTARSNGPRIGLVVWSWALVIAGAVAATVVVTGDRYDVLGRLNSVHRIPVDGGSLTAGGIVALLALAAASLIGAVLGGLAGVRSHRQVDAAGLGR